MGGRISEEHARTSARSERIRWDTIRTVAPAPGVALGAPEDVRVDVDQTYTDGERGKR